MIDFFCKSMAASNFCNDRKSAPRKTANKDHSTANTGQKVLGKPFFFRPKSVTRPLGRSDLGLCMIKIFRGEGVVDVEGGSSERCLKWGGGGGGH